MTPEEAKQIKWEREQDKEIAKNIESQNARLEGMIKNYHLNKKWNRIQRWVILVERIKKLNPFNKKVKTI